MNNLRNALFVFIAVILGSIFIPSALAEDAIEVDVTTKDEASAEAEKPDPTPAFVRSFLDSVYDKGEWFVSAFKADGNRDYYYAENEQCGFRYLFNDHEVVVADPLLNAAIGVVCANKGQYCFARGEHVCCIDSARADGMKVLFGKAERAKGFNRRRCLKTYNHSGDSLMHTLAFMADYPQPQLPYAQHLQRWLLKKLDDARYLYADDSFLVADKKTFAAQKAGPWYYAGKPFDYEAIEKHYLAKNVALNRMLHAQINHIPNFETNCEATVLTANERFVSYLFFTYNYEGTDLGGYNFWLRYSYDVKHHEEINSRYLFRPGTEAAVKRLLVKALARNKFFCNEAFVTGETEAAAYLTQHTCQDGNEAMDPHLEDLLMDLVDGDKQGMMLNDDVLDYILRYSVLPQPSLTDEGVVYSFHPFFLGYRDAGSLHVLIPFEELMPYLTEKGRWCAGRTA